MSTIVLEVKNLLEEASGAVVVIDVIWRYREWDPELERNWRLGLSRVAGQFNSPVACFGWFFGKGKCDDCDF